MEVLPIREAIAPILMEIPKSKNGDKNFSGELDEIMIGSRPLNPSEMETLYSWVGGTTKTCSMAHSFR